MTVQWYERIDRQAELAAAADALASQRCLVIRGEDHDGRDQTARLIEEQLSLSGCLCVRVRTRAAPERLRAVLIEVWEALSDPPQPGVLPAWIASGGALPLEEIPPQLAAEARKRTNPIAVILEDIDRGTALTPRELDVIQIWIGQTGVLVITSAVGQGTNWAATDAEVLDLRAFTRQEIADCLASAGHIPPDQQMSCLDYVCEGFDPAQIQPMSAYIRLKSRG